MLITVTCLSAGRDECPCMCVPGRGGEYTTGVESTPAGVESTPAGVESTQQGWRVPAGVESTRQGWKVHRQGWRVHGRGGEYTAGVESTPLYTYSTHTTNIGNSCSHTHCKPGPTFTPANRHAPLTTVRLGNMPK